MTNFSAEGAKIRVCVIGAGPAGVFTLRALQTLDQDQFEVKCFERYSSIGGLWNFTGKDGIEEDGIERHSGMYYNLRTNNSKYVMETPEFSLSDPSESRCFVDAPFVLNKMRQFAEKFEITKLIQFCTWVEHVSFSDETEKFSVSYKDLKTQQTRMELFDYVIVAIGHFRYPNMVSYPGQETFPGLVIHSRDFMDARRYVGKSVLVVGASYSGEDIAHQSIKEGAAKVTVSRRGPNSGLKWPPGIDERPILTNIAGRTVHFEDGTADAYDVIIYSTGYLYEFPFLEEKLKLHSKNVMAPPLYKQIVMPNNHKLFYIGMQNQPYSFSMFWLQGLLCAGFIEGKIKIPSEAECKEAIAADKEKESKLKDVYDVIDFLSEYVDHLAELTGQVSVNVGEMHKRWATDRLNDITTYKEQSHFNSKFH